MELSQTSMFGGNPGLRLNEAKCSNTPQLQPLNAGSTSGDWGSNQLGSARAQIPPSWLSTSPSSSTQRYAVLPWRCLLQPTCLPAQRAVALFCSVPCVCVSDSVVYCK